MVGAGLVLHGEGIAEAAMHHGRPVDPLQRAIERRHAVAARGFRPFLHPGFVELDDVRAGRLQRAGFLVHRHGVVHRHVGIVGIEFVLRLLRHGERARAA